MAKVQIKCFHQQYAQPVKMGSKSDHERDGRQKKIGIAKLTKINSML